jgi:hypothetical protein
MMKMQMQQRPSVFIGGMTELFHGEKWVISDFLLNNSLDYDLLSKNLIKKLLFLIFLMIQITQY